MTYFIVAVKARGMKLKDLAESLGFPARRFPNASTGARPGRSVKRNRLAQCWA